MKGSKYLSLWHTSIQPSNMKSTSDSISSMVLLQKAMHEGGWEATGLHCGFTGIQGIRSGDGEGFD